MNQYFNAYGEAGCPPGYVMSADGSACTMDAASQSAVYKKAAPYLVAAAVIALGAIYLSGKR